MNFFILYRAQFSLTMQNNLEVLTSSELSKTKTQKVCSFKDAYLVGPLKCQRLFFSRFATVVLCLFPRHI